MSQDLYFLLNFVFVNKIYFLLYGISSCAYVGLKCFWQQKWATGKKSLKTPQRKKNEIIALTLYNKSYVPC